MLMVDSFIYGGTESGKIKVWKYKIDEYIDLNKDVGFVVKLT